MTDQEWASVATMLRHGWTQGFPEAASETYRVFLDRLPVAMVAGSLGRLAERGGEFRPSAAAILAEATGGQRTSYVSGDEAWALIERAVRMIPGGIGDPEFGDRHQAAVDWLREQDESVAAWAARRGLRGPGSLGAESVHDTEHGGAVKHRLALEHGDVVRLAKERVLLGGRAFTPAAFLVRQTGGGGMGELLDRLRPVEQITAGTRAA